MSRGSGLPLSGCAVLAFMAGLHPVDANAESCGKTRDYILASASDDLPRRPQAYQQLYRTCLRSLQLPNVKDAFILRSGAIAVLPQNNSVAATAGTLARFCTEFPQQTLRFITRYETRMVRDVAKVVRLGTSQSTPCQKIAGNG